MIKETFGNKKLFLFDFVSSDPILKESESLVNSKPTHSKDVPVKIK